AVLRSTRIHTDSSRFICVSPFNLTFGELFHRGLLVEELIGRYRPLGGRSYALYRRRLFGRRGDPLLDHLALTPLFQPLEGGIGDAASNQPCGADGIIIARYRI